MIHGGKFALPWLITLTHESAGTIYLVNNNEDVTYGDNTYKASTFDYQRPTSTGGPLDGGTLTITAYPADDVNLVAFFETADETFTFNAVGCYVDGEVSPVRTYAQQYAQVGISNSYEIVVEFTGDDRMDMVFPPYVFDSENNRGNA